MAPRASEKTNQFDNMNGNLQYRGTMSTLVSIFREGFTQNKATDPCLRTQPSTFQ